MLKPQSSTPGPPSPSVTTELAYDAMKFSSTFFRSVILAVALATASVAAPSQGSLKHTTIQRRDDLLVESFHPESIYEVCHFVYVLVSKGLVLTTYRQVFGDGIDHPLSKRADFDLKDASTAFVASRAGISSDSISLTSEFTHDVAKLSYFKQKIVSFLQHLLLGLIRVLTRMMTYRTAFPWPMQLQTWRSITPTRSSPSGRPS